MVKKTLLTSLTATVGLLAGGVFLATPVIADDEQLVPDSNVEYPAWTGDFTVNVNTRGWEWIPSLEYSFTVKNIVDAPCPGGWGPDHQPSANFEQICRFDLSTDAQADRGVVIDFLGGTTITDPKTGNSKTIDDFPIIVETGDTGTGSYFTPIFTHFENPQSPLPNGFNVSLEGERAKNSNYTLNVEVPENLFAATLQKVNNASVGAAADVQARVLASAPADPRLRSKALAVSEYEVDPKHRSRVEKLAAKVHNSGGVLTIHAYGPDEDLALARARAVRTTLEAQLAKRGHTESSPIWVTYAGDPDHKKDTHVTVHWHPDTNLPGALPGTK